MRSSIFNFEPLKSAFFLPPGTHLWHAFLAASAAVIIALAIVGRSAPVGEVRQRIPGAAQLGLAQVLILGDSKLGGLPAESIAVPAVNLAYGATAFRSQAALFKHYQPRMSGLRTLLLDFDNLPFRNPDLERRHGDFSGLMNLGLPWYKLPIPLRESITFVIAHQSFLRPLFVDRRSVIEQIEGFANRSVLDALAEKRSPKERAGSLVPEGIYQAAVGFTYAPVSGAAKMRDYHKIYQDAAIFRANYRAFAEILAIAERHNIVVVLLRVPSTPAFGNARGELWNRELQTILRESRDRFRSLRMPVWVVEDLASFPLEVFHDPNHLNPAGYRTYADYLNSRLLRSPLPDDTEQFLIDGDPNWKVPLDLREHDKAKR